MAKKKTPQETVLPPAAPRRRAPAKKATPPAAPVAGNGRPEPTRAQIAEAAYFRHLKRGGQHGDEFADWIEAERELRDRQ